jgi:hypothetical protein
MGGLRPLAERAKLEQLHMEFGFMCLFDCV